jgi:hypothetical protein
MRRFAPLVLVVVLAGCGTSVRKGAAGDTLKAGSITATLVKWKRHSGYVHLCNRTGQAVISYHFTLLLAGGAVLHPDTVGSSFDVVRSGCGSGSIVFALPGGATPKTLEYRFDDTGSGGQYSGDQPEHDRFDWSL